MHECLNSQMSFSDVILRNLRMAFSHAYMISAQTYIWPFAATVTHRARVLKQGTQRHPQRAA